MILDVLRNRSAKNRDESQLSILSYRNRHSPYSTGYHDESGSCGQRDSTVHVLFASIEACQPLSWTPLLSINIEGTLLVTSVIHFKCILCTEPLTLLLLLLDSHQEQPIFDSCEADSRIPTIERTPNMAPSAIFRTVLSSDGPTYNLNGTSQTSPNLDYRGYDHITWYVGNAKQAATYYTTRMGFKPVARRGLETGSRLVASHVVSNGAATFVLTSPLRSPSTADDAVSQADRDMLEEIHTHIEKHGDAVKDVAFEVDDVRAVFNQAVAKGAIPVQAPKVLRDKVDGEVVTAVIKTYGDTTHTLVDRSRYRGAFLPGYRAVGKVEDPLLKLLPPISFEAIDHCVGNQDWNQMESVCEL